MHSSETKQINEKKRLLYRSEIIMIFVLLLFSAILCVILHQRFFSEKRLCLKINGNEIGFISDACVYDDAYTELYNNILKKYDSEYVFSSEISYTQKNVFAGEETEYINVDDFVDALVTAEEELEYGYALYLNGFCIAICNDAEAGRRAVESAVEKVASELRVAEPAFISAEGNNEIETELTVTTKDSIWTSNEIYDLLYSRDNQQKNHIALDKVLDKYETYLILRSRETAKAEITAKKYAYVKSAAESHNIDCTDKEFEKWFEEYKDTEEYVNAMAQFDAELAKLIESNENTETPSENVPQTNPDTTDSGEYYQNAAAASLIDFDIVFSEKVYETIPRDVVVTEIDTRKTDYMAVTEKGKDGVVYTEYSVSFSKGEFKRTEIQKSTVIEPITEFCNVGTSEYTEPGVVTGKFFWPIETDNMLVSSLFEEYREEFDGDSYHFGIDILGYKDDPVWASDGGIVEFCGWYRSYGNLVIIDHGNGKRSYYAHLREKEVSIGDEVYQGQVIGHIGMTGSTTNYHLHFEIRVDNIPCNPVDFLPETELRRW